MHTKEARLADSRVAAVSGGYKPPKRGGPDPDYLRQCLYDAGGVDPKASAGQSNGQDTVQGTRPYDSEVTFTELEDGKAHDPTTDETRQGTKRAKAKAWAKKAWPHIKFALWIIFLPLILICKALYAFATWWDGMLDRLWASGPPEFPFIIVQTPTGEPKCRTPAYARPRPRSQQRDRERDNADGHETPASSLAQSRLDYAMLTPPELSLQTMRMVEPHRLQDPQASQESAETLDVQAGHDAEEGRDAQECHESEENHAPPEIHEPPQDHEALQTHEPPEAHDLQQTVPRLSAVLALDLAM